METPKISVIIPVYKVEQYLRQCLDSIVNQTYQNLEIILVDDGSPDNCPVICDDYSKKDKRVITIHKENGGLSSARNAGIERATGKYIMFVDSDDWIDENTCQITLDIAEDSSADVVMWPYIREFSGYSKEKMIFEWEYKLFEEMEVKSKLYRRMLGLLGGELASPENADAIVTAWAKLYRADVVNDVRFIDTKLIGTEDALFNLYVFKSVRKAVYINQYLYHYNPLAGCFLRHGHRQKPQLSRHNSR